MKALNVFNLSAYISINPFKLLNSIGFNPFIIRRKKRKKERKKNEILAKNANDT